MARGKQTCKILKEIRRQIAEANGIEFVTSECRYKGDCLGTCPKCEAEVRYLEQQLRSRSIAGKAVAIAGISTAMILMSGCSGTSTNQSSDTLEGEPMELVDSMDWAEGEVVADYDESEVDKKPQFPGGDEAMRRFFDECYSKEKDIIIGSVTVGYVVGASGEIRYTEIIEGDSLLGEQIIRILKQSPDYEPGMKNGKPVAVYMTFPFSTSIKIGVATVSAHAPNAKLISNDPNVKITQGEIAIEPEDDTVENKIYKWVEQMPEYPGGTDSMYKFIADNLKYPEGMADNMQGRVIVKFYVDTLGRVCEPLIVRGIESALDREALRVVNLFPYFIPGQHEGKNVNVWFTIPITFRLSD